MEARSTRHALTALAALGLVCAGCTGTDLGGDGPDSGRTTRGDGGVEPDGGAPGSDGGTTGMTDTGPPIGTGAVRDEICGNEFDDDDDGRIDDGCDCAVGTERPCWLGPPDARDVGACHDGVQRCESEGATATWGYCNEATMPTREILDNGVDDDCDGTIDEPDGICVNSANEETGADCGNGRDDDCDTRADCDDPDCAGEARCPGGCEASEAVCWGGYDEDCDGAVDCDDPDCSDTPSCHTGPCPPGQTPTYRERDLGSDHGASNIRAGDGDPKMPVTCEEGTCPDGQVAVVLVGRAPICVPPPPECPPGTHPNYVASGRWRCDPPCDLIIHYGSIYGGRNVCAGRPMMSCPTGQVPTFVEETEVWECRPTCSDALYDRIMLDGSIVCVPC